VITEIAEPVTREARERAVFTPEQQKAFDRAFRKREAKLRRHYADDMLDMADLLTQLLVICGERIELNERNEISKELEEIRKEYGDKHE
jgi:hypothetical protein